MALGRTYNSGSNSNKSEMRHPQVSSNYKWYNGESKIDRTALTASFWKGMLRLGIAPRKDSNDPIASFDYQNDVAIFIGHTKARILHTELIKYINGEITDGGVDTNKGLISICKGTQFGHPESDCLVIRIINEHGKVDASACYEFKTAFHKSVQNFNEKTASFDTLGYSSIELLEFATLLEQYYMAMTNAVAYSTIDSSKYKDNSIFNSLGAMKAALGIKNDNGGGNKGGYNNNSYFNSGKANSSTSESNYSSTSYDDLASELEKD